MLLEVEGLTVRFGTGAGAALAVDDVSFSIAEGETLGLVGESGCGKSTTGFAIMRLVEEPGRIAAGKVSLDGRNLLELPDEGMRSLRGSELAMVFQEPMTSLNPVFTIGDQLAEALLVHQQVKLKEAWARAEGLLREVGISDAAGRMRQYPHEMSGGMKQRVMIAMALMCSPRLLIADEPTTALDVTVQAQILELLRSLQQTRKLAMLLITHNLGVVAETAARVCVMYAARIVEDSPTDTLFAQPLHPYTKGLLACLPGRGTEKGELAAIPGAVPDPSDFPAGCRFHPRCPLARDICRSVVPPLEDKGGGRKCACHLVEKAS